FILYRQHHQARVVAENPGLANPEISKIIGEKWRAESDLHKEEWKQLAEEEKLHHQRKYPEYKYQPRRGNKNSVAGGIGSNRTSPTTPGGASGGIGIGGTGAGGTTGTGTEHPGRCPNCGGRYIATPRTPSTPFAAAAAGMGSAKSVTGEAHGRGGHGHGHGQSAFNMSSAGMDTPRGGMKHHASSSSSRGQQQHYGQQQGGGYRDHRASVSSQGGGYQAYPSRDYHHSQTYPYPTPSHHQQYPAHPLYDMPQEYDVSTPTGTGSKRRRLRSSTSWAADFHRCTFRSCFACAFRTRTESIVKHYGSASSASYTICSWLER
ncbi:slightly ste11-like protein, partial [Neurospora sp. IMI 360204]